MKHLLLTTFAAVLVVGCGPQPPDISIHSAALDGNIEAVKQAIADGANVNASIPSGLLGQNFKGILLGEVSVGGTPLHSAACGGHKEIAELLISKGADVNAKDKSEQTPLAYAALGGHKEIVKLLIAKGANVNAETDNGWTPLLSAALRGHKEIADLLIAKGADLEAKNEGGSTPLHGATLDGHNEVVELLIANGADVNAKEIDGMTPLHRAALEGHNEIVKLLIAEGADVNAKDEDGDTPLDATTKPRASSPRSRAILSGNTETADLLRKHGGKTKKELKASEPVAETSQPETPTAKTPDALFEELKIEEFVAKGGMGVVRKRGENKITIYEAANIGDLETVEKLLESGTDVNQKNRQGYTPLMAAGTKEIAEFLISKGASVNESTIFGTALHEAVNSRRYEVAKVLLENGASVNAKTNVGKTPLDRPLANSPTSYANTAARPRRNWKPKQRNETPPTNNNRSRDGCGVWRVAATRTTDSQSTRHLNSRSCLGWKHRSRQTSHC